MKKFLIIAVLVLGVNVVWGRGNYTYSPAYIQHLKNCSTYTDEYSANVPTNDEKSPYLKVKSSERIMGWINGKCATQTTIYSLDLNEKIMVIKCNLSKAQIESIMEKMKAVNSKDSIETKQAFSDEMVSIIEDGTTCKVKDYMAEN